ncbi:MAG: DUF3553 domain-containing protein [Tepidisphaera sp.]|nr:DUF3553 domain-containing protein [Tepidisphaera sp.]
MAGASEWNKGDSVVHAARPEWGAGEVLVAEPVVHEGRKCQRLTIRFSRGGTKTISTAFAELKPASELPRIPRLLDPDEAPDHPAPSAGASKPRQQSAPSAPPEPDPLALSAMQSEIAAIMNKLPEKATDPFTSGKARLAATLDLYKYTDSGGSLLDWAAIQTGLADPLSRFSRHELEQWFARFKIELDAHLRKLVRDVRKADPAGYAEATASVSGAAKGALRKAEAMA